MGNSAIKSIARLVVTVVKPDTYKVRVVKSENNKVTPLVINDNGDVRLNYDSQQVRQNIYKEMKKYAHFQMKENRNLGESE